MASVNFNGLGSGIDFSALTESILAERSRPMTKLQAKSADLTKRSDALKQLNNKLAVLTSAAKDLSDQTIGTGRISTSSNVSTLLVSNTDTAATGSAKVNVSRLATSLTQASRVYTSSTAAILAGGATSATFELRLGGASSGTQITINSQNNTLEGLRDEINKAKAGVTAAIVDIDGKGNQFKLVLSSEATGSSGRVELVETSATGTAADVNLTSQNVAGGDFTQLDAALTINGLSISRSSNNISDALTGMTLNLKGTGEAVVSVTNNTSAVTDKLSAFIDAYNDIQNFIAAQYKPDSSGRPTGLLAGDPTLRAVQQQLRESLGSSSTDNGGSLSNLTQLGIGRDADGKLTLDTTTLNDKLASAATDVRALLAGKVSGKTGLANSFYNSFSKLSDNVSGTVQTAINGYQTSIKNLDKSVTDQLARISSLRTTLSRQFAAADAAISQLNGQGSSLTSVIDSLKPKSK